MQHQMHLDITPFEQMKNGSKIIEARLFDEKRQQINPGDEILFRRSDDPSQELKTTVVGLYRYRSFRDLFSEFSPLSFGGESVEDLLSTVGQYYSKTQEQDCGVVGIRIMKI